MISKYKISNQDVIIDHNTDYVLIEPKCNNNLVYYEKDQYFTLLTNLLSGVIYSLV